MMDVKFLFIILLLQYYCLYVCADLISFRGTFDEQVEQILKHQELKVQDWEGINQAMDDITMALQDRFPGSTLLLFGSVVTGLGTSESDIAFLVVVPDEKLLETNTTLVAEAAKALEQYPELFIVEAVKEEMRIPTTAFIHLPSLRNVDISFTGVTCINNTRLVNYLMHTDSRILTLAQIIKYWMEVEKIDGEWRIASYIFTLMVIFFMQHRHGLPSVMELQRNAEPVLIDNWNVAFEELPYELPAGIRMFDLLLEFLEYYSKFEYDKYVISPYAGYPVSRSALKHYKTLPAEFDQLKTNMDSGFIDDPMHLNTTVVVQDLFELHRNVAGVIYDPIVAHRFKLIFKRAVKLYRKDSDPDKFLTKMFSIRMGHDHYPQAMGLYGPNDMVVKVLVNGQFRPLSQATWYRDD